MLKKLARNLQKSNLEREALREVKETTRLTADIIEKNIERLTKKGGTVMPCELPDKVPVGWEREDYMYAVGSIAASKVYDNWGEDNVLYSHRQSVEFTSSFNELRQPGETEKTILIFDIIPGDTAFYSSLNAMLNQPEHPDSIT